MNTKSIQTEIKRALARSGLSASAASRQATGNASLVKNILNGHIPRADSLIQLADVLGLEFYIGPSRDDENLNQSRVNSEKTDNAVPRIWSLGALPNQSILGNYLRETDQFGGNDALDRAYEVLADDGFLDPDTLRRVAIAFRALEISPLCADAYLELCDFIHLELDEEEQMVRLAIDAAERSIHPDLFISDRGHFWEHLGTRPYVRARHRLAYIYKLKCDMVSAVREYWNILELDNGDHLRVRYPLLVCLLKINDQKEVDRLFEQFRDDISAHMLYTRMLIEYMRQCDGDGDISLDIDARRLAKQAYKANTHIPQLLSEYDGSLYKIEQDRYRRGSEEEALVYSDYFGWKWADTTGAVNWLLRVNKLPEVDDTDDNQIAEPSVLYETTDKDDVASARPVSVMELAAAAGGGALELDERVVGQVWFRRDWLDRKSIDSTQCNIISVKGESMEPTLPDGCSILLDRSRQRRQNGHIFVLLTDDGLVVKRLGKDGNGDWQLVSDHSGWKAMAWQRDTTVVGEVMWVARSL